MKRLFCIICIACAVAALAVSASAEMTIPAGTYHFVEEPSREDIPVNKDLVFNYQVAFYGASGWYLRVYKIFSEYASRNTITWWQDGGYRGDMYRYIDVGWDTSPYTNRMNTNREFFVLTDLTINHSGWESWLKKNIVELSKLPVATINLTWELDNAAIIAIDPPDNSDFIGYRLYKNNVPERYISADSLEVRIESPGSYYITVIYPGEAPEDPDRESDPSNVIEWNGQYPSVYLSISNNNITWLAPATDKEVGEYTIYLNGYYVASVTDTAYSISSGAYGLYQVRVLYAEGGESLLSNPVRYGYYPAIESVHIGTGGFVSFVPKEGQYSGYVTGYTIYYSDDLESERTNEIQIIGNSFQLPNSCTFSIVTHYLYGDSVPSQVFIYQSDLVYDLIPGISSGIDGITGSMKQFIDGYEKPSRPSISATVNEYDQFTDEIINDLDYYNYAIDQYSSTLERYTAGFNFWGEIFGLFIDIPVINAIVLIWASIAIFSLFFGSVIVGIIVYRPRKEEDRYQNTKIGFTAPLSEGSESVHRKVGFE